MLWPRIGTGWRGEPWNELRAVQREMSRLFDLSSRAGTGEFPSVNVYTKAGDTVVTAELPGVDSKEIEISVEGSTLTIRGNRKPDAMGEDTTLHRQERGTGTFVRSIQLPYATDPEKVEAKYERGVLRIGLPIAEKEKPRQIAVKTA